MSLKKKWVRLIKEEEEEEKWIEKIGGIYKEQIITSLKKSEKNEW